MTETLPQPIMDQAPHRGHHNRLLYYTALPVAAVALAATAFVVGRGGSTEGASSQPVAEAPGFEPAPVDVATPETKGTEVAPPTTEKAKPNPDVTESGQFLEYEYYPRKTIGRINFLPNNAAAETERNADLGVAYVDIWEPKMRQQIEAGEDVEVAKGTCFSDVEYYKDDYGNLYTSRRYYVNPLTYPGEDVYFAAASAGSFRGIINETASDGSIVRTAFGLDQLRKTDTTDAALSEVRIEGGFREDTSPSEEAFMPIYSGSTEGINWRTTGIAVTDIATGERYVAGGIVNAVNKGNVDVTPEQEVANCEQFNELAKISA